MTEVQTEEYNGSDCSGNNGALNRVLTLSNTTLTQQDGFLVHVAGLALALTEEYTVSHLSSGTQITFLNPLWDDLLIIVNYHQEEEGETRVAATGDDFVDGPLADFGVTVTRTPVTATTNFSGQKTYTDGSTNDVTAVFINPNQNFALDKSGLTEVFDAKICVRASETINKYDKITYNSKTYRVDKVNLRKLGSTSMFKSVILFFAE